MLKVFLEIVLALVGELLLGLGLEVIGRALGTKRRRETVVAMFGWLILGLGLGGFSVWLHPKPFLRGDPRGRLVILLVIPVLVGLVMRAFGRATSRRGKVPTSLATFPGGAMLAFGINLVRYLSR